MRGTPGAQSLPIRLVMVATSLALALIASVGWYVSDSADLLDADRIQAMVLVEDGGRIASLNDGLCLAARQFSISREGKWLRRYQTLSDRRDELLRNMKRSTRGGEEEVAASDVVEATSHIKKTEDRALELAQNLRTNESEALLLSTEYLKAKEAAATAAARLGTLVRSHTEAMVESRRGSGRFMLAAVALAVSLLLFTWIVSLRVSAALVARRRREESEQAEQSRRDAFVTDVRGALTNGTNLNGVTQAMVEHLGAEPARIYILEANGPFLELKASAGTENGRAGSDSRIRVGEGAFGVVAAERTPVAVNRDDGFSLAGVPLVVDMRVIGVLAMYASNSIPQATLAALSGVADTIAQGVLREHAEALSRQYAMDLEQANKRLETQAAKLARTAEELGLARDAALESARLKSQFVANMSHEIRTPMTGILGMTDLTLDTHLTAEQREYVSLIKSSADSLLSLLNDILDFSKIEAGKLDFERAAFSLRSTFDSALRPLEQRAFERGLRFSWEVATEVPDEVLGDTGRLRQILVNLTGNAIKFTAKGEVAVRAVLEGMEAGRARLQISVSDTGIGIPREKRGVIFQPFMQADGSTTRKYGGTGLGLAICQQLLRLMGGSIWVDGDDGAGSTFTMSVPFELAGIREAPVPDVPPAPSVSPVGAGRRLRVLLVEDNAVNQRLVSCLLEKRGHLVSTSSNGLEALEALDHGSFDLVLMDVQMPIMGGLETTEEIRRRESSRSYSPSGRIPIVAMTASAMKGDRERCLSAGMDAYVSKPLDNEELFDAIESLPPRRNQAVA